MDTEAIRGEHISVLCLMSTEGVLTCKVARGGVNSNGFLDFVENLAMPNLNPRSVVIIDNCSIHHIDAVTDLLHQTGV